MAAGYGPDYQLPGLPHRTGHGCGLDIHEAPNLVKGEMTPLDVGMVFSCEPMLVLPDKFGVRLEDHFYMTEAGPNGLRSPRRLLMILLGSTAEYPQSGVFNARRRIFNAERQGC